MKKFYAFVLALVMVACMFTACTTVSQEAHWDPDLTKVPEYSWLYYSENTHTVYYIICYSGCNYMTPYIVNGHFCEYRDGQIVEVVPTVIIQDTTN